MKAISSLLIILSCLLHIQGRENVILVNKSNPVPKSYEQEISKELCELAYSRQDGRETQKMVKDAAKACNDMLAAAKAAGFNLTVTSGYRSYEYQQTIYNFRYSDHVSRGLSEKEAKKETEKYIAPPGFSEHHTGLCADIHSLPFADVSFAQTNEYRWLINNCANYGFILRYPLGKEDITGFSFEPWHFRYVGNCAQKIMSEGITLEEYVELKKN